MIVCLVMARDNLPAPGDINAFNIVLVLRFRVLLGSSSFVDLCSSILKSQLCFSRTTCLHT